MKIKSSEEQRKTEQAERNQQCFKKWQYKMFHKTNILPVKRQTYPVC